MGKPWLGQAMRLPKAPAEQLTAGQAPGAQHTSQATACPVSRTALVQPHASPALPAHLPACLAQRLAHDPYSPPTARLPSPKEV